MEIKNMYLIVKCEELDDQYECDANRTPVYITEDWTADYPKDYRFEVWEIKSNNNLECIKSYHDSMDGGMAYGYYTDDDEEFHLIEKFPGRTRKDCCPKKILKDIKALDGDYENCLKNCGYICTTLNDCVIYVYGEYTDNQPPICW